jgi:hypothetical protein
MDFGQSILDANAYMESLTCPEIDQLPPELNALISAYTGQHFMVSIVSEYVPVQKQFCWLILFVCIDIWVGHM